MSFDGADDPLVDGAKYLVPNEDGSISVSFLLPTEEVIARRDERTGEMTLERRDDRAIILATRSADAFHAGVSLLSAGRAVLWLGFMLVPQQRYVMRQVQP